jgi:uncharacterized protein
LLLLPACDRGNDDFEAKGDMMTVQLIRRIGLALLFLVAPLSLSGCYQESTAGPLGVSSAGLDLTEVTITQGEAIHRFTVEIARTTDEQARGLMERTELAANRGMLFPFPQPKFASFWMRNTLIPLDIIFIRGDGTIDRIAENAVPQDETPVVSGGEVHAVLELAGGTTARLGIDESATIRWAVAALNQPAATSAQDQ